MPLPGLGMHVVTRGLLKAQLGPVQFLHPCFPLVLQASSEETLPAVIFCLLQAPGLQVSRARL